MTRVLVVMQSVAAGGMETHAIDLAAEYVARGLRVAAVVPCDASLDAVAGRFVATGSAVLRIDTDARRGRARQLLAQRRYLRALRRFRPDVVHIHTGGATGGLLPVALARLCCGATVVITEHDVPAEDAGWRSRLVRRLIDRVAHAVVAVSRRNAAIRRDRAGANELRFAAVLNGVPIRSVAPREREAHAARVRQELGIPAGRVVIGSLVRLAAGKGLATLLEAFARLDGDPALLLVGDGPLREALRRQAADLGVARRVYFAGHRDDPIPYLDAMDVFALAVPAGSQSIALLEAMARGLPPVITFCGPEEAVIDGETGLCARPDDVASLTAALSRLVDDAALRSRLGQAAASHVAAHFSTARVADDLLELYQAARCGRIPPRLLASSSPGVRRETGISTRAGCASDATGCGESPTS
ncbi:MAG: glycosyltransferase family 4 protein [Dehalococcoidia bacterium]